jgi:hypothetical protein
MNNLGLYYFLLSVNLVLAGLYSYNGNLGGCIFSLIIASANVVSIYLTNKGNREP